MGRWGWYYFGGGLESQADRTIQDIQNKVAADAVQLNDAEDRRDRTRGDSRSYLIDIESGLKHR